jgi:hypothetical protein
MSEVEFGPKTPVFEQAKIDHALHRTAPVTGTNYINISHNYAFCN